MINMFRHRNFTKCCHRLADGSTSLGKIKKLSMLHLLYNDKRLINCVLTINEVCVVVNL